MAPQDFSLSTLIHDVDDHSLLAELLELYQQALVEDKQYSIPVLIPVLKARIQLIVSAYGTMSKYQQTADAGLEKMVQQIKLTQNNMASFYSVISASESGSSLDELSQSNNTVLEKLTADFNKLFLQFNTQIFKESEIDFDGLSSILSKLTELTAKDIYQTDWMIEQLEDVDKELKKFARKSRNKKWRVKLAGSYESFRKAYPDISKQQEIVVKQKASNPLVSEEAVELATKVNEQFVAILGQFDPVINQVYQYECNSEAVDQSITNYLLLSSKVNDGAS